jgi:hypothetical protein
MKVPDSIFTRLKNNPLTTLRLIVRYGVVDRIRYSKGDGYDARSYWNKRFQRHGFSLLAVGHEGLSEGDNL